MKWTSVRRVAAALLIPIGFAACESLKGITELEVPNQNAPDATRAIASPEDVQALISGGGFTLSEAMYNNWYVMVGAGSDEFSASWGNFGMRDFSSEPRVKWNNASNYGSRGSTESPWFDSYGAISSVYDGIRAINDPETAAEFAAAINVPRANAFGKWIQGMAHAWLALVFDSAFVLDENVDLESDTLQLLPYPNVMEFALGFLQEAHDLADGKGWNLEQSWWSGNDLSGTELAGWSSSFYALFLASMARTPAEAASLTVPNVCAGGAACWALVESKAAEGITKAFGGANAVGGTALGFVGDDNWWHAPVWYSNNPGTTWARGDYKLIGYTETGAGLGYDAWLASPVLSRVPFDLDIPDTRITPGPPPHTQFVDCGTYFCKWSPTNMDPARGTYHWSSYTSVRFQPWRANAGFGFIEIMTLPTLELIQAEAMMRQGNAGAAAIINKTRVPAGLPMAADADADIDEQLYYEMLVENYSYCSGCAYWMRRRAAAQAPGNVHHFGLLVGTPIHFPVPGSELEVLQKLNYSFGGGDVGSALAPSTEPYCRGVCGGAVPSSAALRYAGPTGGTTAPASVIYKDTDRSSERPRSIPARATRYQ